LNARDSRHLPPSSQHGNLVPLQGTILAGFTGTLSGEQSMNVLLMLILVAGAVGSAIVTVWSPWAVLPLVICVAGVVAMLYKHVRRRTKRPPVKLRIQHKTIPGSSKERTVRVDHDETIR